MCSVEIPYNHHGGKFCVKGESALIFSFKIDFDFDYLLMLKDSYLCENSS